MKLFRSNNEIERFEPRTSNEEIGTKDNPYQPPWIRKLQEIIAAVVFLVLVIGFYNLFMHVGGRVPAAVKDAQSYLESIQQSAQKRLDAAELNNRSRREQMPNPASPAASLVHARALGGAPGAIICQDYQSVTLMFSLYNRRFEDRLQDTLTKGLSRSIRGEAAGEPDPAVFGCSLILDGKPMMKEPGGMFPVVSAQLDDGTFVKGITMPPMIMERAR